MLEEFLNQIGSAITAKLYLLALSGALMLPDICGALESDNGEASKERYIKWFDENLGVDYGDSFTGEDCWHFRCAMLHQGRSNQRYSRFSKIFFLDPTGPRPLFHGNTFKMNGETAYNIEVNIFCLDMLKRVRQWSQEPKPSHFKDNYNKFLRRYPSGLPPFIVGIPVIG